MYFWCPKTIKVPRNKRGRKLGRPFGLLWHLNGQMSAKLDQSTGYKIVIKVIEEFHDIFDNVFVIESHPKFLLHMSVYI